MNDKSKLIYQLVNLNMELCRNDSAFNDKFIIDLLLHGFKGFENMSFEELIKEQERMEYET